MSYHKAFQQIGLAVGLFFGGLVGGLLSPLPSDVLAANDANPTLRIKVDWTHIVNGVTVHDITDNAIALTTEGTAVACTSAETTAGWTFCYPFTAAGYNNNGSNYGPPNRKFFFQNSNGTAKFYVADTTSGTLEKMTVSNFKLIPAAATGWTNTTCATCGESVVVTLTATNTFNLLPNDPTTGGVADNGQLCSSTADSPVCTDSYTRVGLQVGGVFTSSTSINPYNDEVQVKGEGIFVSGTGPGSGKKGIDSTGGNAPGSSASTLNTTCASQFCPSTKMYFKVGGTSLSPVTQWNLTQDGLQPTRQYPSYRCKNDWSSTNTKTITNPINSTATMPGTGPGTSIPPVTSPTTYNTPKCTPTITQTYAYNLFGPDENTQNSSIDLAMYQCGTQGAPSCGCKGKKCDDPITKFFESQHGKSKNLQLGISDAVGCGSDICNGKITVILNTSPNAQPSGCGAPTDQPCNTFNFNGTGPDLDTFTITTDPNTGDGEHSFTNVWTGEGGYARVITTSATQPPKDTNSQWQIDSWHVFSLNGTLIAGVHYDIISAGLGVKPGVILYFVPNGWTVQLIAHGHNCQSNCS